VRTRLRSRGYSRRLRQTFKTQSCASFEPSLAVGDDGGAGGHYGVGPCRTLPRRTIAGRWHDVARWWRWTACEFTFTQLARPMLSWLSCWTVRGSLGFLYSG
jgi:hypothetical protein